MVYFLCIYKYTSPILFGIQNNVLYELSCSCTYQIYLSLFSRNSNIYRMYYLIYKMLCSIFLRYISISYKYLGLFLETLLNCVGFEKKRKYRL